MKVATNRTPAQQWADKQKQLDAESRELTSEFDRGQLEDRIGRLTPERQEIHRTLGHDPKRCRCFEIEGV